MTVFARFKKIKKQKHSSTNYFMTARTWADDYYAKAVNSRARYQLLFFIMSGLSLCSILAVTVLAFHQSTQLVIVHQTQDGNVWVEPATQPLAPINSAQTESDIVRYVQLRESFDASSYDEKYALVELLSSTAIAKDYGNEQSLQNQDSPINVLGRQGVKTIHIDNVVFLDNAAVPSTKKDGRAFAHSNLAEVNFVVTEHLSESNSTISLPMTALISWEYTGIPKNPSARWQNWNGFTVTHYTTTQRNVSIKRSHS
jgi:type IV secretion system protein VirB8